MSNLILGQNRENLIENAELPVKVGKVFMKKMAKS